jgi:uncharacterized RDD family membrane protein YckC
MNHPLAEANWGLFARRAFAFVIDFLLFISVMTVLIRLFNAFLPGNDVREDPMQLYTQKEFHVFFATFLSALVLLTIYMLTSYLSKRGQTIGHRVAGVRMRRLSGGPMRVRDLFWVVIVACVRVSVLVTPGPFFAAYGGKVMGSVFLLVWGAIVILPIPVRKDANPPLTLWEFLGRYRFELAGKTGPRS